MYYTFKKMRESNSNLASFKEEKQGNDQDGKHIELRTERLINLKSSRNGQQKLKPEIEYHG